MNLYIYIYICNLRINSKHICRYIHIPRNSKILNYILKEYLLKKIVTLNQNINMENTICEKKKLN